MDSLFVIETTEKFFEIIDTNRLAKLMPWIQIERYARVRRISSFKGVKEYKKWREQPKEEFIESIQWFDFTLEQLKMALLLMDCVPNGSKAQPILQKWRYPLSKSANVPLIRHAILARSYHKPSFLLFSLIFTQTNPTELCMSVFDSEIQSENEIHEKLKEMSIPDEITSLPMACNRFRKLYFMYDLMTKSQIAELLGEYDLYIGKGNKIDIARAVVEHTNFSIADLVEYLDLGKKEHEGSALRKYFSMVYGIGDDELELAESQFKNLLKDRMHRLSHSRKQKLSWNEDYWSKRPRATTDGTPCDSHWEVEVHDYLLRKGYEPLKPTSATEGQYYEGSEMYPDWVVGSKMIELFGAEYLEGYPEKTKLKKATNVVPLISISPNEFRSGRWKQKLLHELGDR